MRHFRASRHRLPRAASLALALALGACAPIQPMQTDEERMRAALAEQARQEKRPSRLCPAEPGSPFAFRKKVVMLSMPLARPLEGADLPGITTSWPQALQQRLQDTDRLLVRDGSAFLIDPAGDVRRQVVQLARRFDAQFVIAGRIDALGVLRGRIDLGPLRPIPQPFDDLRVIETTLAIHDGLTGALVRELHHRTEIRGQVDNRSAHAMQGDFFHTPLGQSIATLLTRQSEDVEDELACLPMMARVVHTQGHLLHINAGFTSNLELGSRLRLFQRQPGPAGPDGEGQWIEKPYGELVVTQIQPESAIGHLDSSLRPDPQASLYVRAW